MQTNWHRAVLVSLLMIFSSLAGCLEAENDEAKTDEIGTIMASTYHVQQLVQAIVGDEVTVELMSTSNIPVHDYEPTANDIIRLQQSDIFFYHGLELEPWVDATLSGLGSDAPLSVQTHTLPTGETLLDYESLLIADLCETLDDSEFESVQLANGHSSVMPEIHAESVLHQLTFPAMDDDHDEDGHDEDGHDEDGHDDDDDDLVTPEELLEDADTDDSGTMTLDEFNATFGGDEIDVNDPKFAEIFDNNDADTSGDLDVNELEGFITEIDAYLEGGHSDDHDEDGHDEDGHDEDGTDMEDLMEMMMQLMFEEMDANNDSILDAEELASMMSMGDDENHAAYASLHVKEEGEYGFALPPGVTMHILANDGHDDHGHGSHDGHSDENVCYDMTKHTVDTSITTEQECIDAGLMWTASNSGPESDDDHDEDGHDEDGHDEEELNLDPHSWLSPLAFKQQVSNVLDILVEKYPDMESKFTDNANAYMAKLDSLHSDFEMTFSNSSTCESNTVVANHNAYNYIGVKYNIEFVTVHGLDPEGEPSAQDVAEVVEEIKENDIKVLFIEEYTDPTAVDGIVQETGVTLQYLYTMELPPSDSDDDYLSLMNKNLNNLKSGLACTN